MLTGHHYPLGCNQVPAPSIARLLSQPVRFLQQRSLNRYIAVAHASGIPFRMDETGSVSCGGEAGISDTFAAALWATEYIASSMASGAVGINFEGNPANCLGYSPLCAPTPARLRSGELRAQPAWYALLLTRGLIGSRPLPTSVSTGGSQANVVVRSFAENGSLRFVVVDDDPRGAPLARIDLHVGKAFGAASVLPLSAPAIASTSRVTLGGSSVGPAGHWTAGAASASTAVRRGVATVTLQPSSAALITVTATGSPQP